MAKYKHGKINQTMEFSEFNQFMSTYPFEPSGFMKALLAFLYWTGVRVSEATERTTKDFTLEKATLIIDCPPKKHGERLPLQLPLDLPYVIDIVEAWKRASRTYKQKRMQKRYQTGLVFPCTTRTARRWVKAVFGERYYPHFFRLNRATKFLNDPTTTIPQMKSWFGWKAVDTVNMYIGYSKRAVAQQAQRLHQDLSE